MAESLKLEGLDEVLEKLNAEEIQDDLERIMGQACALVERDAKKNVPSKTGELRRSITSEVQGSGADIKGIVYTPLLYAPYIEYGTGLFAESMGRQDVPWHYQDEKGQWHTTSGIHPMPYMRPALNDNRENIIEMFKEGLKLG